MHNIYLSTGFGINAYFSNRATNDNLLAGTGTTEAQILADLAAARAAMMEFEDSEGEPLGFMGIIKICSFSAKH